MPQQILHGIVSFAKLNPQNYLLVCGKSLQSLGIGHLFSPTAVFSDFTPNPLYEQVCKAVEVFRDARCETIVAVGGGSAIDVSKCVKLFCQMSDDIPYLQQEFKDTGIQLIAIPTTAGTGSESTRHAVIYKDGVKQSVCHESIVPDIALLEPQFLANLPIYHKKSAMLDALCQCIESYWAVAATAESRLFAVSGIRLIKDNWRRYIYNNDIAAASAVMLGANYSGRAINITATTAAHAMSYKLTSFYGLAHGHAVALCLPHVWRFLLEHADAAMLKILSSLPISLDEFQAIMGELEMDYPTLGRATDVESLASSVNPLRLENSPISLSETDLKKMYMSIIKS